MQELSERLSSALAGRYRISQTLGAGGMSVVYRAEDLKHDRPVAIKILKPELASPLSSERFLREIRIASRLQHPNILALFDSGEAAGLLYYVMPFVAGESLRARLTREGRLLVPEALRLVREVAEGLGYAHENGVVHRDIKPENILLSSGHALISDFGIGRALTLAAANTPTERGLVIGTPAYMSPEQFGGGADLDSRSDIYSLGCVLYEVLAGVPPFIGLTGLSLMVHHSTAQPPSLRRIRSDVSASLEETLARALAKDAADRFATVAELTAALDQSLETAPLTRSRRSGTAVAVLPFANLSGAESEYLSDGISEELMQALGEIEGLRIVGRTSSFAFKGKRDDVRDIGAQLRADVVVDGSVRAERDRVRISAQLVNAADGYQLWSARYERAAGNTFALEDEIARTIAGVLRSRLAPGAPAIVTAPTGPPFAGRRDPASHEAYLKGHYHWNKRTSEGIARSITWFEQAAGRSPDDPAVHAALAQALVTHAIYGSASAREAMPRAKTAGKRALTLDPGSAEAHTALASVSALYDWAWQDAEQHFRLASDATSAYPTAHQWRAMHLLTPLARFDAARTALQQARALDPLSPAILTSLAVLSFFRRDWDRAFRELGEVLDLEPAFAAGHYFLGQTLLWKSGGEGAEGAMERAVSLAGRSTETVAGLAYVQAAGGRGDRARALLGELTARDGTSYVSPARIAQIHLGLGDCGQALDCLERALDHRCPELVWLGVHPMFDPLREEKRFIALLERTGLSGTVPTPQAVTDPPPAAVTAPP
ncbi:MAG: protein kinase [Gemmatimonadales bacterium]